MGLSANNPNPVRIALASYMGNGLATQTLTGLKFTPKMVQIYSTEIGSSVYTIKTELDTDSNAAIFDCYMSSGGYPIVQSYAAGVVSISGNSITVTNNALGGESGKSFNSDYLTYNIIYYTW